MSSYALEKIIFGIFVIKVGTSVGKCVLCVGQNIHTVDFEKYPWDYVSGRKTVLRLN